MRLIFFTFVPNWRCFELSSEDSVSTFFGCFCFWSWWLWATFINRILSLQFYLVSSSSAAPSLALLLQPRDPNYGYGDTNTFSKRMFEQFTEYLTGWQICEVPMSSEGWKWASGGLQGLCPVTPLGAPPQNPAITPPPTANPLASPLAAMPVFFTQLSKKLVFRPTGATRYSDKREIWHGGADRSPVGRNLGI